MLDRRIAEATGEILPDGTSGLPDGHLPATRIGYPPVLSATASVLSATS